MKKIIYILLMATLLSCGDTETVILGGSDGADGLSGIGCSIAGNILTCGNDTFDLSALEGIDGLDGSAGIDGTNGRDGTNGMDGINGEDGASGVILTIVDMPASHGCYVVAPGLWAENEGGTKADLYNNDTCDHRPSPKKVICSNMHSDDDDEDAGELCGIGNYIFLLEGGGTSMQMYVLDFNGGI